MRRGSHPDSTGTRKLRGFRAGVREMRRYHGTPVCPAGRASVLSRKLAKEGTESVHELG